MRIAKIMYNDTTNGQGVCVSLWVQGCPFHCNGCHNQSTWDPEGGEAAPNDLKGRLIKTISANGIQRNFSVLGGEPLAPYNRKEVSGIIAAVRAAYPKIKIFLWTGYTMEELQAENDSDIDAILKNVNYVIDGRYIEAERDLTLELRGSRNQRIIEVGEA